MRENNVSVDYPFESKYVDVLGSKIHYIEQGSGTPILLLHGVPASSYIWRNIIPHLSTLGHCIAPDLIGMGKSDKPDIEYSIDDHIKYINKFIETLGLKKIILVMHGWGSLIGFNYAVNHEDNCKGLVFYESFLREMSGDTLSLPFQEQLSALESDPTDAFDLITNGTHFVDQILPQSMLRELSEVEKQYYREPFTANGSSKPLQTYLQEIPRGDGESKIDMLISSYSDKLLESYLPKLLLYSIPGFITTIATVMWAKEHLHNLEIAEIGEDLHYAQESNPQLMGETIGIWLQGLDH